MCELIVTHNYALTDISGWVCFYKFEFKAYDCKYLEIRLFGSEFAMLNKNSVKKNKNKTKT